MQGGKTYAENNGHGSQINQGACGMCEAHVNDAVRAAFPVKKVTSSHSKKETVIITDTDIPEEKIKEVIKNSGYDALEVTKEPYEKKGLFSAFRK